jgi:hypothetical protein
LVRREVTEMASNSRVFKVDDLEFGGAKELKYLGSTVTEDNNIVIELKQRTVMANRANYYLKKTIKFTTFRETHKVCSI